MTYTVIDLSFSPSERTRRVHTSGVGKFNRKASRKEPERLEAVAWTEAWMPDPKGCAI